MSKVEGGGGGSIDPPPSRLRVTIFSSRLLGLNVLLFSFCLRFDIQFFKSFL